MHERMRDEDLSIIPYEETVINTHTLALFLASLLGQSTSACYKIYEGSQMKYCVYVFLSPAIFQGKLRLNNCGIFFIVLSG